jgi:hypothetical protein
MRPDGRQHVKRSPRNRDGFSTMSDDPKYYRCGADGCVWCEGFEIGYRIALAGQDDSPAVRMSLDSIAKHGYERGYEDRLKEERG